MPTTPSDHARASAAALVAAVDLLAERGWQPAELLHQLRRPPSRPLLAAALLDHAAGHEAGGRRPPPRWVQQLDSIRADHPEVATDPGGWLVRRLEGPAARVDDLIATLRWLPELPVLLPPPSTWTGATPDPAAGRSGADPTPDLDPDLLRKVSALLAKAESTTFEGEAEVFMAKAQELITRHAIDEALLLAAATERSGARLGDPGARRIVLHAPYVARKASLLGTVARANRGRAVYDDRLRLATVVAYPGDLDAIELLYASLLLQATEAVQRAGRGRDGRSDRGFRSSFLLAFAVRIGQRLDEASGAVVAESAGWSSAVVPVLDQLEARVDDATAALFPHTRPMNRTAVDAQGWAAGHAAADQAELGTRHRLGRHR